MPDTPTSGHGPALPLDDISFLDFPPEARALPGRMTAAGIKSLARQAAAPICCHIDEKTLPTDPREGATAARSALARPLTVEIDGAMA